MCRTPKRYNTSRPHFKTRKEKHAECVTNSPLPWPHIAGFYNRSHCSSSFSATLSPDLSSAYMPNVATQSKLSTVGKMYIYTHPLSATRNTQQFSLLPNNIQRLSSELFRVLQGSLMRSLWFRCFKATRLQASRFTDSLCSVVTAQGLRAVDSTCNSRHCPLEGILLQGSKCLSPGGVRRDTGLIGLI